MIRDLFSGFLTWPAIRNKAPRTFNRPPKISRQSTSKWHNQASCLGKGASHIRTNLNFTFRQPEMVGKSP